MGTKRNVLNRWLVGTLVLAGMAMTSCHDDDANNGGGNPGNEVAEIYQDPSLVPMNENEFNTTVPELPDEFDQSVVDALKANPRITDVKPFLRYFWINPETGGGEVGVSYFFNYIQDIDHNNPKLGTFKQQCVLSVAGKERPTVLLTHGYSLGAGDVKENVNRIDYLTDPSLVSLLNANCLHVEHRYHGWSLPEGWTNKWTYLNTKQQSDDLHAIVTTIKKSGIISEESKWLSTGVSKSGETTAFYAFHYPNDMDAYVSFCAPFLPQLRDPRPYRYIFYEPALDEMDINNLKEAFVKYCSDKDLQAEVVRLFIQKYGNYGEEFTRKRLLKYLFGYYYDKMSYVKYDLWKPLIPKKDETNAQIWYDFIMASSSSPYSNEMEWEYWRRKKGADNEPDYFDYITDDETAETRLTRAASLIDRADPYKVQCCLDLGESCTVFDWVKDILTDEEKAYIDPADKPEDYGVTYDNGAFMKSFLAGMKTSKCHMLFVYGTQDPWTGARIPDECLGENSQILMIENGTHNDYCDYWNKSELSTLTRWLDELGFMTE